MPSILEIPEVRQRVSPLSLEEYHRLDEFNENGRRTELIRGIVIEKISKSPLHSSIGNCFTTKLRRCLLPSEKWKSIADWRTAPTRTTRSLHQMRRWSVAAFPEYELH